MIALLLNNKYFVLLFYVFIMGDNIGDIPISLNYVYNGFG